MNQNYWLTKNEIAEKKSLFQVFFTKMGVKVQLQLLI